MRRRRSAIVAALVVLVASCSHGSSNTTPPPVNAPTEQLVVLGGDSAFGADLPRDVRLRESWPQLLLADLPPGSAMIDLAARGATTADLADRQVTLAADLHPTIAVVSLEGNGAGAGSSSNDVARIIDGLRAVGASKVLVVDPAPASTGSVVHATVSNHDAVVVDTSAITATGAAGNQQIASAIKVAGGLA
jgi:hypothetical protein